MYCGVQSVVFRESESEINVIVNPGSGGGAECGVGVAVDVFCPTLDTIITLPHKLPSPHHSRRSPAHGPCTGINVYTSFIFNPVTTSTKHASG